MKEMLKLVFVLSFISFLSGLLLAVTHKYTEEPIRLSEQRQLFESLGKVLPPSDGEPITLSLTNAAGRPVTIYVAFKNGAVAGAALAGESPNGYGGAVEILLGVNAEGAIQGLEVTKQSETPGLGTKMTTPDFIKQFLGKPLAGIWKVAKDGGSIDAISGATISSRAFCDAVSDALATFQEFKTAIAAAAPTAPAPASQQVTP